MLCLDWTVLRDTYVYTFSVHKTSPLSYITSSSFYLFTGMYREHNIIINGPLTTHTAAMYSVISYGTMWLCKAAEKISECQLLIHRPVHLM